MLIASAYDVRYVRGHFEVYLGGVFQFSADTLSEVYAELREYDNKESNAYDE